MRLQNESPVLAGLSLNGCEEILIHFVPKEQDIGTRLAPELAFELVVWPLVWWEDHMTNSDKKELVAITTLSHEKATSACSIRCGLGSDGDTKHIG